MPPQNNWLHPTIELPTNQPTGAIVQQSRLALVPYDLFCPIYDHFFGPDAAGATAEATERLLLPNLGPKARILDLCCGTGELSRALSRRGRSVTVIDNSKGMLNLARARVADVKFHRYDIRYFRMSDSFDAAISAYNSLAHITTASDFLTVLANVRRCLNPQGLFLFDLYGESAYAKRWKGSFSRIDDDFVCIVNASYNSSKGRGENAITTFCRNGEWVRSDFQLTTRCYSPEEIRGMLLAANFTGVESYDAEKDLHLPQAAGRVFWRCRKAR
jgi:SAM-dependent methyltransferase